MAYTTIDDPGLYFNTVIWSGDGNTPRTISGVGFQPDWVWLKHRSGTGARDHYLSDVVRGATKSMNSNRNDAEVSEESNGYTSAFTSDGFTVIQGTNSIGEVNDSNRSYVAWNWKAGGSGSSNTDGDVTTTVSASTTAGFSICGFTEAGSAPYSFGHGLGVEPDMVWFKTRPGSGSWQIYFKALGSPSGKLLQLDNTNNPITIATWWGTINSSIVTINAGLITPSTTAIAYCFAEKQGYSKFSTYTGNGSTDGPFVYCGFKPAFVLVKRLSGTTQGWYLWDNRRNGFNPNNFNLEANDTALDDTGNKRIDLLSNGFKWRSSDTIVNNSGTEYLFIAFAESPQVNSNGIPNNAE